MKNKILTKKQILKDMDKRIKKAKQIENICKQICEKQGIDPERLVCKMMPELINQPYMAGFFLPNPQYTMPAWWLYRDLVELALEIIKCPQQN